MLRFFHLPALVRIRPAAHSAPRLSPEPRGSPPLCRCAKRPTDLILRAWWVVHCHNQPPLPRCVVYSALNIHPGAAFGKGA